MRRTLLVSIAIALASCGHDPSVDAVAEAAPLVVTEGPILTAPFADLTPPDTTFGQFGWSIAVTPDGSRLVVGSRYEVYNGVQSCGAVRIFRRAAGAWVHEQTLRMPTPTNGDFFGTSVGVQADGARLVVGVPGADGTPGSNSGVVRVYTRSGMLWSLETVLPDPMGFAGIGVGTVVAINSNGTRIAADALTPGVNLRIWRRPTTTWAFEALLPESSDAMALSGDGLRIVLGRSADATRATGAGSVRIYLRGATTWAREVDLYAPDAAVDDALGISVAISDDGSRLLAGASGDDVGAMRDAGSARTFVRTGTTWAYEGELDASDPADGDALGYQVALMGDGTRALVTASRDDVGTRVDAGSVRVFFRSGTRWTDEATLVPADTDSTDSFGRSLAIGAAGGLALASAPNDDVFPSSFLDGSVREFAIALTPDGGRCGGDTACVGGFCVDGVCCSTACGGNTPNDCQACSAALTGGVDGTCAALSATAAPTVVCRVVADACDAPDTCAAGSTSCPPDGFAAAGLECRARADACDRPETCTGTSAVCPADLGFEPAGVVCRPAVAGTCDAEETCTGTSASCPVDGVLPSGTSCRTSIGSCDLGEVCDGLAFACPGDAFAPAGSICRARTATCDLEETCTGSSGVCPVDAVRAAGTVCALRGTAACDVDDVCDGATGACPPTFAAAGTACAPAGSGVCDAPDVCTGTSADCVATFAVGVICRESAGACDPAETCTGASPTCPIDALLSAGRSCRASTSASCDPEEVCDGLVSSCPSDVNSCVDTGVPDAGPGDAGAHPDDAATGGNDAATAPPPATGGCGCALARRSPAGSLAALVLLLALARSRRRR